MNKRTHRIAIIITLIIISFLFSQCDIETWNTSTVYKELSIEEIEKTMELKAD